MRVAVDLEDVIVDTSGYFIRQLNSFIEENHPEVDLKFQKQDISNWEFVNLREEFAEIRGWEKQLAKKFMYGDGEGWKGFVPMTEEVWRHRPERLPLLDGFEPGQVDDIKRSIGGDAEVSLVTARKRVKDQIIRRLKQDSILDLFDDVVVEADKHILGFDVYVDDYPELCKNLKSGQSHLMVDQPWNRHVKLEKPHRRIKNIGQAVEVIRDVGRKV